eukprot:TRINITY_DN13113_c0_g1_i3.p1 TRINITY_DN13113_c0_g1~~TRINITY_DN13113_c0_g1_i3.p1  ORF type:complete len:111 (-),score=19.40 TRINITY_DN13113_c0_g1_i3:837-1169(-)
MTSSEDSVVDSAELEEENFDVSLPSRRRIWTGLLLRQLKDFWRVALLMSTLLSTNNDHTEEFLRDRSKLEEKRDTFMRVEDSIIELGEICPNSYFRYIFKLVGMSLSWYL